MAEDTVTISFEVPRRYSRAAMDAVNDYLETLPTPPKAPAPTGIYSAADPTAGLKPARSVDWQGIIRDGFKAEGPDSAMSTSQVVKMFAAMGIHLQRTSASRYLAELAREGYLKTVGEGKYRAYRLAETKP